MVGGYGPVAEWSRPNVDEQLLLQQAAQAQAVQQASGAGVGQPPPPDSGQVTQQTVNAVLVIGLLLTALYLIKK